MDYRKVGQQKSAQHHLQHQHDNSSGSSGNTGTAPPTSQSTTSTTATTEQQIPVSGGGATSSGGEQQSQKQSAASQEVLQPSSAPKSDTTRSTVAATPSTNAQVVVPGAAALPPPPSPGGGGAAGSAVASAASHPQTRGQDSSVTAQPASAALGLGSTGSAQAPVPSSTALVLREPGLSVGVIAAAAAAAPAAAAAAQPPAAAPAAAAAVSSQPPAASGSATSSYLMAQMPKSEKKPVLRPAVFDKLEQLVKDMQDEEHGVPVRSQKLFLTSIPAAFMGYDLIEWLMDRLNIEDSLEAVHLANLLCQFGYYFPVNELKNLLVKDDSSLYRFQAAYYWPSQTHTPDNLEYAVYLAKRSQRNRQKHGLEDYELEAYNNLRTILAKRWDLVDMQAQEQIKVGRDRKKGEKIITDSQEKAYWRVYRPPPGYTTVVESSPVPSREQRVKARNRTMEHLSEEVNFLRNYGATARVKVSQAAEGLIEYCDQFFEYDPVLCPVVPSNPWFSNDDNSYWIQNQPLVDQPTEKRVRKWAISLEDLVDDPQGLHEFLVYLKREYSHENLRFWMAVQELRYGPGTEAKIKKKVKEIWDEFLSPGAKAEINIDAMTMEATKTAMKTPSRYTYEKAADHVFLLLLKNDCYPRFIRSQYYRNLLANAVNPGNQKKRFFSFGAPKPKVINKTGAGAGASAAATGPGPNEKMPWEEFNIHGADGGDCSGDSPEEGSRKICATYSSKDADDNICPWEDDGPPSTRHLSKESPKANKEEEGSLPRLVRRGSDPTSSSSTPKSPRAKAAGPTVAAAVATSSAAAGKKTGPLGPSSATTTLMQAVKDLPGTPAGILTSLPCSSTSQAPPTVCVPPDTRLPERSSTSGECPNQKSCCKKSAESVGSANAGSASDMAGRMARASSTEGTLGSGEALASSGSHHHHTSRHGCSSHHHHHYTASRRTKNRSRRKKGGGSSSSTSGVATHAKVPAEQKDPGNPGEPSPTAGAQQLPIDEALARVAITTQQGSEGEGVGSSKQAKSHQKPHHQLSTSSLLTLSLAPASVLATAPLDQTSGSGGVHEPDPSDESAAGVGGGGCAGGGGGGGVNRHGTSSKCTQTRMAASEEMLIPTSPTLARQSPLIGGGASRKPNSQSVGGSDVGSCDTSGSRQAPHQQAKVPAAGTSNPTPSNTSGGGGASLKSSGSGATCGGGGRKSLKASGSSDRGSDSEAYKSDKSDKEAGTSDPQAAAPVRKFEHCAKHCSKAASGGEGAERSQGHRHHHKSHHCTKEKKSKQQQQQLPPQQQQQLQQHQSSDTSFGPGALSTSSEPVEGPGPPTPGRPGPTTNTTTAATTSIQANPEATAGAASEPVMEPELSAAAAGSSGTALVGAAASAAGATASGGAAAAGSSTAPEGGSNTDDPANACEKKGEGAGKWATEVCPWEDEKNKKESHAPFVKTYATLGYL